MHTIQTIIDMMNGDKSIRSATKYISPKNVIRVTRRLKPRAGNYRNEYVVTIGVPNYLAVRFIKKCVKAGEPFPVKKIQPTFYPKEKKVCK